MTAPQAGGPDASAAARIEAATAVRRLYHTLAGTSPGDRDLHDLATRLDELTATIADAPVRDRTVLRRSGDWGPAPISGEEMFSFDERPISGRAAPLGLDMVVRRDGDEAVGHLTLDSAHEGAPRRSHGGIVSALFDDLFGFVLTIEETAAFTGELAVRYEAATPIHVPLECRVRLTDRDGRKLFMTGELSAADAPDTVFARSTATFIAIDQELFSSGGGS